MYVYMCGGDVGKYKYMNMQHCLNFCVTYMCVSRFLASIYYYWLTDLQSTVKHHMYKRHLAG